MFTRPSKRLKGLFDILVEHTELSIRACDYILRELTGSSERHVIDALAAGVDALERHGDELTSRANSMLSKSTLPVTVYGDMHILIDLVDDVLDELYFIAQEVGRGKKAGLASLSVVWAIYQELASMVSIARLAVERLRETLKASLEDLEKARYLSFEIYSLEDRIDEFKNKVIEAVYSSRGSLDALALYHLVELAKAVDRVVDICKESSHVLLSVMTSITS